MNDDTPVPMEVLQPSSIHALEKAQIDVQVATAHQYPRSIELFRKRALSMALLDEDTAESCIYCRPVGKEKNEKGEWREKIVEGPSIRLAEIVGCSYGNLRVASRIVEQTERYVKCEGVCHDLEANYAGKCDIMEVTVNKEGQPYSERQRAVTAKVALAKAYRDAIFKVVPRALCKPILDAAKKVAAGKDKPLEERRKKAIAWVGTLRVDESRVFNVLGVKGWSDVMDDHLITLTGLKTALADGDHIDDVFPRIEGAPAAQTKAPKPPPGPQTPIPPAAKAPAKTPQKPPEEPKGPVTPPEPEKPKAEAGSPAPEANTAASDAAAEAEMGLTAKQPAPQPPETTPPLAETTAPPAAEQPQTDAPAAAPDPKLAPRAGDSDALASVKLLAAKSGVTYTQVMEWARANKLAKEGQGLADLSEAKLLNIGTRWATILPKMRTPKE